MTLVQDRTACTAAKAATSLTAITAETPCMADQGQTLCKGPLTSTASGAVSAKNDHGDLTGDGDTVRGIETVSYESATAGITVDLRARTGRVSGRRQTDRLVTPRELLGSEHADVLIGSSGDEAIYGLGGNDRIEGEDGRDYLLGGEGDDVLRAGPGDFEELAGGPGHDTLDEVCLTLCKS